MRHPDFRKEGDMASLMSAMAVAICSSPVEYEERPLTAQEEWRRAICPDPEEEARATYYIYREGQPLTILGPASTPL